MRLKVPTGTSESETFSKSAFDAKIKSKHRTIPKKVTKQCTNRSRKHYAAQAGQFYSRWLDTTDEEGNDLQSELTRLGNAVAHIIPRDYVYDQLKAPSTNKPQSAMLSRQAFNLYFSTNKEVIGGAVSRCKYGYVTARAIGLDQREVKIYPAFAELAELMTLIQQLINKQYSKEEAILLQTIDMVSVKIYWVYRNGKAEIVAMKLNEHVDVKYGPDGVVIENNNQAPYMPVGIMTIGDPKLLKFQKYKWFRDGEKKLKVSNSFWFRQTSGRVFVLDPRDEIPTKRPRGKVLDKSYTFWKHSCRLENQREGISMSLAFRVGTVYTPINPVNNTQLKPKQAKSTDDRFNEASLDIFSNPHYQSEVAIIAKKLAAKFPPPGLDNNDYEDWLEAYEVYKPLLDDMRALGFID